MNGVVERQSTTGDPAGGRPDPAATTGRGGHGLRDMALTMVVLAAVVLALAALSHSCSFSPGGPSSNSSALPTVDVPDELRGAAGRMPFPLREPRVPADWRANSASSGTVGDAGRDSAVTIGWVTGAGSYLALVQSNAKPADLVRYQVGQADDSAVTPRGQTTVDGVSWVIYPGIRSERVWVADLGAVRLLITGSGDDAQFRTLAAAATSASPVTAAAR